MPRYVITGGAGFIGSNVADYYLSRGNEVTLFDNFSRPGSERNLAWLETRHASGLRTVRGDITNKDGLLAQVVAGADVLFHLAGQVAVTTSVTDPMGDFLTNAFGTFQVLEAARRSPAPPIVLYSSTNKVYGKMADLGIVQRNGRYAYENCDSGISEARPLDPYSPYGCSKCAGDQYVLDYARIYDMQTVVFRQSCIYGPRQFGMEDQGWLAWFSIRALQRRPVTIYGDGKQVRDVLFVEDLVAAYDAAIRRIEKTAGKAYNIGGGPANTMSLLELVATLNRLSGHTLDCSFEDWRPGDQPVFISDVSKAKRDFGWAPGVGVEEGVERLIRWIEENSALFEPERAEVAAVAGAR